MFTFFPVELNKIKTDERRKHAGAEKNNIHHHVNAHKMISALQYPLIISAELVHVNRQKKTFAQELLRLWKQKKSSRKSFRLNFLVSSRQHHEPSMQRGRGPSKLNYLIRKWSRETWINNNVFRPHKNNENRLKVIKVQCRTTTLSFYAWGSRYLLVTLLSRRVTREKRPTIPTILQ